MTDSHPHRFQGHQLPSLSALIFCFNHLLVAGSCRKTPPLALQQYQSHCSRSGINTIWSYGWMDDVKCGLNFISKMDKNLLYSKTKKFKSPCRLYLSLSSSSDSVFIWSTWGKCCGPASWQPSTEMSKLLFSVQKTHLIMWPMVINFPPAWRKEFSSESDCWWAVNHSKWNLKCSCSVLVLTRNILLSSDALSWLGCVFFNLHT